MMLRQRCFTKLRATDEDHLLPNSDHLQGREGGLHVFALRGEGLVVRHVGERWSFCACPDTLTPTSHTSP